MKIAAGQARAVGAAGAGAAAGPARRNLSRNVRRSGSAGNIGRSGVPYLWTKNVVLWTVFAFMDKKCIFIYLWTRNAFMDSECIYGQEMSIYRQEMHCMDETCILS